ncbi:MAG: hypothetical protein WCE64_00050 [Bacteroidales bacterium]
MKRVLVLLMTGLFAVSMIQGQTQQKAKAQNKATMQEKPLKKLYGPEINQAAKKSFAIDFGNVPDVKWRRSDYFDEARFTKDGKAMVAFYDSDGILVGTTSDSNYADLPKKGQEEISSKYKDYVPGTVIYYKDNEMNTSNMILYNQLFDDEDNYFVELSKGNKTIVVTVSPEGNVNFFVDIK